MVQCDFCKDEATKYQGDNGYADSSRGSEEPDKENESADANAEKWRNVDFGEQVIVSAMQTFIWIWLIIHPVVVFVHFQKGVGAFGNPNLVRCWRTHISTVS